MKVRERTYRVYFTIPQWTVLPPKTDFRASGQFSQVGLDVSAEVVCDLDDAAGQVLDALDREGAGTEALVWICPCDLIAGLQEFAPVLGPVLRWMLNLHRSHEGSSKKNSLVEEGSIKAKRRPAGGRLDAGGSIVGPYLTRLSVRTAKGLKARVERGPRIGT